LFFAVLLSGLSIVALVAVAIWFGKRRADIKAGRLTAGSVKWDLWFNVVVGVVVLLLLAVAGVQVRFDGWRKHVLHAVVAILVAATLLVVARRLWDEIGEAAASAHQRKYKLTLLLVALTLIAGTTGYAMNAWFYNLGGAVRDNGRSSFAWLASFTPPEAELSWKVEPTRKCDSKYLLLGESNLQYVLFCKSDKTVQLIPRTDARVIITPKR
jgi:hypothetical protein